MVAGIAVLIVVVGIVYFLFFRNSADAAVLTSLVLLPQIQRRIDGTR